MSLLKKIVRGMVRLLSSQPVDPRVLRLREYLIAALSPSRLWVNGSGVVLAVQGVEDPLFFGLFAALTLELKSATGCRAELLQIRSINGAIGTGWLARALRSWPICVLFNRQWANANVDLVGPVAYRSHSLSHPLGDLVDWLRAHRLWQSLQGQSDISTLTIEGVVVGDLVIDSYLRFRPSPRFDLSDPFVRRVLWQCLRDLRRAKDWFGRVRPPLYLSSYSTYIEHGVAVRVALSLGTAVYVYGNITAFGRRLSKANIFHTADTTIYRREFEALPDREQCLEQSAKHLAARLSGGVDDATAYMKVSAYVSSDEAVPDVQGAVVVFLHDFYDSPHVYADMVFPDFWAWVDCTIRTLRDASIPFWIKPHPNQIAQNSAVLDELRSVHPAVRMLSAKITNAQLVAGGMQSGITVYGTVAHELAYFGVPSICCARHPHTPFDFCRTATSVTEYVGMLRTPGHCPLPKAEMKRQALAFYYMHNLHGSRDFLDVRHKFVALWKTSNNEAASPQDLCSRLDDLRGLPGWRAHVVTLIEEIDSHVL